MTTDLLFPMVFNLNGQALNLITANRFEEGVDLLCKALHRVAAHARQDIGAQAIVHPPSSTVTTTYNQQLASHCAVSVSAPIEDTQGVNVLGIPAMELVLQAFLPYQVQGVGAVAVREVHNTFALYDRAFYMVAPTMTVAAAANGDGVNIALPPTQLEASVDRICVVLLYNMALSFHLMVAYGKCSTENEKSTLLRALTLYQRALYLLPRCGECHCNSNMFVAKPGTTTITKFDGLLQAAIANNLGSIFMHFYRIPEANRCGLLLQKSLNLLAPSSGLLGEEDFAHFQLNVLYGCGRSCSGAPAA